MEKKERNYFCSLLHEIFLIAMEIIGISYTSSKGVFSEEKKLSFISTIVIFLLILELFQYSKKLATPKAIVLFSGQRNLVHEVQSQSSLHSYNVKKYGKP